MAQSSFQGIGWAFPVAVDGAGRISPAADVEAIERSIVLILGTARGERLMRPDFGSDLHSFVFKPLSETNKARLATAVKNALTAWEPRIRVLAVEVRASLQDPATALIAIEYQMRKSNTRANLVYPFYLGGVER